MKTSFTSSRRKPAAIGAGSMADIAFLLLIFFLVATTILNDQGILVRLPKYEPAPPADYHARNILSVKLNAANALMVEGQPLKVRNLRSSIAEFVLNPQKRSDLAISPARAVVSLQHDRGTGYAAYIEVYDEIVAAYREMWDAEARQVHGKPYAQLSTRDQKTIRMRLPMVISEAEPTDFVQAE